MGSGDSSAGCGCHIAQRRACEHDSCSAPSVGSCVAHRAPSRVPSCHPLPQMWAATACQASLVPWENSWLWQGPGPSLGHWGCPLGTKHSLGISKGILRGTHIGPPCVTVSALHWDGGRGAVKSRSQLRSHVVTFSLQLQAFPDWASGQVGGLLFLGPRKWVCGAPGQASICIHTRRKPELGPQTQMEATCTLEKLQRGTSKTHVSPASDPDPPGAGAW